MKETSRQFSSASPSCCCPPGSLTDARLAEAPSCQEPEENEEMEKDGVLTAEVVSSCVSHLGRICTGLQYFYHHLSLPSHSLRDVSILCNYVYLQKLELPHNKIKDLSCVSHMPYLIILDASHNQISNFFGFQPPKNLKEVNFSHNCMTKMKDLSAYTSLCKLDLDHNSFSEISGLERCCKLTQLSLAHNKISKINGLDNLPLTDLCLRGNQMERIEGLENLKTLKVLDLSLNRVTSLSGLQNLHLLGSINLEKNLITEIQECKHIHDLFLLRDLNLLRNPVQEQPDYRLSVVFLLQHLMVLDQEKVTAEDKVSSINKYDPPLDVVAARDHMTHLVYQLMQPQVLYDSTLPSADSPYPMLVLTGPQGCGKRELAHRLCQEFSEYFAYGTCHTTRGPYLGEENGSDYHFVSEEDFQNIIHMGKFIQTMQYGGHSYGLTRDSIEDVAREGLACCVHMELEGVLSLKNSHFEPRYILLIPTQLEKYTGHLKSRGLYTPAQVDMAVSRIELYANFNRQRPGFFDNVIPCDDWEEAYQMLGQVVKDYLLLDEQGEGENNSRASPDNTSTASGHGPEERPPSDLSRSGSGTMSLSATALDPSDPSYRNYFTKIQAQLSPQKSPAELASIRRREQLVREAIVGRSPGVYSQLFKSSAQTAPSSLLSHDPGTHFSEDSSSDESHASSVLSVPSSAGALSGLVEPLDMSVQGHTLEDHMTSDQTPNAARPGTDQLAAVTTPSSERRPGSNVKPILPPIPTGRKTPAALSPAPSPSPNPAGREEAEANREG
ncbi:leucine-rich repeat and guanylate kinase domain-containing protein isoform X1 [Thunnus maccoyii]|uniref:leucine-rich repeat and guanylate kinase domain-containing protein isoform X1 n=2 Tax=Thunnus maccoyii TaxID=8240 RepID=UPI001C4D0BF8|nr:leucine-rich repeat and guanylate kinase domain-containing protein isoform X1 [Thunnus maccoyii]XP_042258703.1 leucine-rich repeat and guanylate kinase domain-containing protein isoform X1 [Thunnus maccoyii]